MSTHKITLTSEYESIAQRLSRNSGRSISELLTAITEIQLRSMDLLGSASAVPSKVLPNQDLAIWSFSPETILSLSLPKGVCVDLSSGPRLTLKTGTCLNLYDLMLQSTQRLSAPSSFTDVIKHVQITGVVLEPDSNVVYNQGGRKNYMVVPDRTVASTRFLKVSRVIDGQPSLNLPVTLTVDYLSGDLKITSHENSDIHGIEIEVVLGDAVGNNTTTVVSSYGDNMSTHAAGQVVADTLKLTPQTIPLGVPQNSHKIPPGPLLRGEGWELILDPSRLQDLDKAGGEWSYAIKSIGTYEVYNSHGVVRLRNDQGLIAMYILPQGGIFQNECILPIYRSTTDGSLCYLMPDRSTITVDPTPEGYVELHKQFSAYFSQSRLIGKKTYLTAVHPSGVITWSQDRNTTTLADFTNVSYTRWRWINADRSVSDTVTLSVSDELKVNLHNYHKLHGAPPEIPTTHKIFSVRITGILDEKYQLVRNSSGRSSRYSVQRHITSHPDEDVLWVFENTNTGKPLWMKVIINTTTGDVNITRMTSTKIRGLELSVTSKELHKSVEP